MAASVINLRHWADRKVMVHPLGGDSPRHPLEAGDARLKSFVRTAPCAS